MKIFIDYYKEPKTKKKIYKLSDKYIFFLKKYKENILKKKKKELRKKKRNRNKILTKKKFNIQPKLKLEVQPINIVSTNEDLPLSFYLENSTDYTGEDSNINYSAILERDTLNEKLNNRNEIELIENKKEKVLIQSKSEENIIENENLFQEYIDKIKAKQNKISKQIRKKQLRILERERIRKLNQKKEVNIRYNESVNKRNIEEFIQGEKEIEDNIIKVPNVKKEIQIEDKLCSIEDDGFEVKDSYGKVDGLYYKVDNLGTIEVPIVQDEDNKIFLKIPKEGSLNKNLNIFIGTFNSDKRTIYLQSKGKYDMRVIKWICDEKKKYRKLMNDI